jgi:hypothetical protein
LILAGANRLSGEVVVMRYCSKCTVFTLGAVATLGILVAALEVSVAAIPVARGIDPASINRTFKSDRGPALPGSSRVEPSQQRQSLQPTLPEGCVSEADGPKNIYSDEIAGRCVA